MSLAPPRSGENGPTLVAGAGGFLGRQIVRDLTSRGVRTVGLVRSWEKAVYVREAGGVPVIGDILDVPSLRAAAAGCARVVHVASAWNVPDVTPEYAEQVRVVGARNLVRTAAEVGARRCVLGSGYWVYAGSPDPITEATPVAPDGESRINYAAEQAAREEGAASGIELVVVRPGMVYGDGAWFRSVAESIRAGTYRTINGGSNYWSFVALADAGTGFRAALESGRAGEVYNLVDGAPAPWGEFAADVARALGRPTPETMDTRTSIEAFGSVVARHLAANRFLRSEKLRSLGWVPAFPDYRAGLARVLDAMRWP